MGAVLPYMAPPSDGAASTADGACSSPHMPASGGGGGSGAAVVTVVVTTGRGAGAGADAGAGGEVEADTPRRASSA